jgi:predicted dienelactone hydrolase
MNNLINFAKRIPTPEAALTVAYTPIRLPMPGRQPLDLRLTAPATGNDLPIVILSHGFGPSNYIPSKDGYAPLAQFWAERGFVVMQPTHASSRIGGLPKGSPGAPFFWRERVEEIKAILDHLTAIEEQAPAVAGRWIIHASAQSVIPLAAIPLDCCWERSLMVRIFPILASRRAFS